MSLTMIVLIFFIGFIGSFISGMLGVGGSIVNYPMLLYIPPLLGLAAFSVHEVTGISAVQVLFATIAGVWLLRKDGYLNKRLIVYMGISVLIGSLVGGFGSTGMSENTINIVYGVLALLAAILMFVPTKGLDDQPHDQVTFNGPLSAVFALIVGIGSGIVGAGGAFLLVPIMLVVLRIPIRMAIASSLAITFISSLGGTFSKLATGQVEYIPSIIMVIASIIAAPLGVKLGKKMEPKYLKGLLVIIILGTTIKIWMDIL